jgi:hypothetical protein
VIVPPTPEVDQWAACWTLSDPLLLGFSSEAEAVSAGRTVVRRRLKHTVSRRAEILH